MTPEVTLPFLKLTPKTNKDFENDPTQANGVSVRNNTLMFVRYERTDPSLGRLKYKQKCFVNVFACEMLPTCQVKVQIALKFVNLSIPPQNSGIM